MFGEKLQGQVFGREVYAGLWWGKPNGRGLVFLCEYNEKSSKE